MNPVPLILGGLALWYLPTILTVLKIEFSVLSVVPVNVSDESIDFMLRLKADNRSGKSITINSLKMDVILEGKKIGIVAGDISRVAYANSTSLLDVPFSLDYRLMGQEMFIQFVRGNLKNTNIKLTGNVIAENKKLPFSCNWKISDLTNL